MGIQKREDAERDTALPKEFNRQLWVVIRLPKIAEFAGRVGLGPHRISVASRATATKDGYVP